MSDYGALLDTLGKPLYGPRDIDVGDRPDPDRPDRGRTQHVVRGARRHDAVRSIYGERSPELLAADRFRDDCAAASGARLDGERAAMRVQGGGRHPEPATAVLEAIDRARAAWAVIGLTDNSVVCECVLGSMAVSRFDRAYGLRNGTGAKRLAGALERLVSHYDGVDNGRR